MTKPKTMAERTILAIWFVLYLPTCAVMCLSGLLLVTSCGGQDNSDEFIPWFIGSAILQAILFLLGPAGRIGR